MEIKNVLFSYILVSMNIQVKVFCSSNQRQGGIDCLSPTKGIKEPLVGIRNPYSISYRHRWTLGSMVSYTCPDGFKFPDGHHSKISTCSTNKFHSAEWMPNKFYSCIRYCSQCLNGGRCVIKYDKEKSLHFKCLCTEHYAGSSCQYAICPFPTLVAKSYMDVFRPQYNSVNGLYVQGTEILYKCEKSDFGRKGSLECDSNGNYRISGSKCYLGNIGFRCPNQYSALNAELNDDMTLRRSVLLGDFRVVPGYYPNYDLYSNEEKVSFKCPPGYRIEGQSEAVSMHSTCSFGKWNTEWPICKAKLCEEPSVRNGVLISEKEMHVVGSVITLQCLEGYYIFESHVSQFKCMNYGYWHPSPPDCITQNVYRNKCLLKGRGTRYRSDGSPYCSDVSLIKKEQSHSELNAITIVTASAAAIFGVLLLIVLIMALQRRRLLHRIRLQEELDAQDMYNRDEMSPQEAMIHFILPSYDEAVRTKPTMAPPSFEDVLNESVNNHVDSSSTDDSLDDDIYISPRCLSRNILPSCSSDTTVDTLLPDTDDCPPSYAVLNDFEETSEPLVILPTDSIAADDILSTNMATGTDVL